MALQEFQYKEKLTSTKLNTMVKAVNDIDETVKNMLDTLTILPNGEAEIKQTGAHIYLLSYSLSSSETVEIKDIKVSMTSDNATVSNVSSEGFTVNADSIPMDGETVAVKIEVTEKHSGKTVLNYQVRLVPTPVESITIDGADVIATEGDYNYTITESPADATIHVKELDITITEV